MDILNVILLFVIIIIIISNKTSFNQKFTELEFRIVELQNLLKKIGETPQPIDKPTIIASPPPAVKPSSEVKAPVPPEMPKPEPVKKEPLVERQADVISDSLAHIKRPIKTLEAASPKRKEEPSLSFFERYPDLEKFIGENLINKIGIAILVLAIGFFVKYAIDNNWVGPVGRVGIGVLCGAILIGFAHRMRNSYKAFSSVLIGGGLAIFYFTISLAYQQFHLFSQLQALIILTFITLFAVVLSLLYDKQELAVIALLGGFGSPFMVSNGSANYNGLFLYLLILNAGLLIIAYHKAWPLLNITAFGLSVIVFTTVLFTLTSGTYIIGFRFASIYYLLFFTINIINNVKENKKFLAADFSILLINTALYFATGLYLLTAMHLEQFRGLFSASLAALNLVLSFILFRNRKVDTNVLYLLIGITLTFISLTAPIQLHGNNITLFWASETVLLYWLYQKSGIQLMKLTSLLVWLAMFISLFIDLVQIYSSSAQQLQIIVNKGYITTVYTSISTFLLYLLLKRDKTPDIYGIIISPHIFKAVSFILLFAGGLLEINHQFLHHYPATDLNVLYLMLYSTAFIYVFDLLADRYMPNYQWKLSLALLVCLTFFYLTVTPVFFDVLRDMLEKHRINTALFTANWFSAIFITLIFYRIVRICLKDLNKDLLPVATWILSAAIVTFLSLQLCLLSTLLFYSKTNTIDIVQTVYVKSALPVLWGLISFVLMWIGMRNKQRVLRIISLSLFSITLLKLFIFDINNIPVAGKIAAFFCLGVLLLIISFMYQKVKKIITEDEPEK